MVNPKQFPITLEGAHVSLVPLDRSHCEGLAHAATMETFDLFVSIRPSELSAEGFYSYVDWISNSADTTGFAVIDRSSGNIIGSTCYLDIRPQDFHVEVGLTWYSPSSRGTMVNPECKLLLLTRAFETLGSERVSLKTDGRNHHSQAAIAKLGAIREGTLRKHKTMPDGYLRDTVYFSILKSEWPTVKESLLARLGQSSK